MRKIDYQPPPTIDRFHRDSSFVRMLMGPLGSGKSVGSSMEVFTRACEQQHAPDGIRHTRWAITRNTYRELQDTTIRTWMDWFGTLGEYKGIDNSHTIRFNDIHCEVMFRALDRPDDVKKLLSLELTGAWMNEAREQPRAVFDALQGRVGRYPSARDGGASWFGIFGDTNPPDTDHWIYKLFEEERPEGHVIFHQPSGLAPDAENTANLPDGYYQRIALGKKPEWVKVYVHGEYGHVADGKPVYTDFSDATHVREIEIIPTLPMRVGIDFGLTPAAVLGQRMANGRWLVHDELVAQDMGAKNFSLALKRLFADRCPGLEFANITGDPAGDSRAQTDETTPFQILNAAGIAAAPASTNDPILRIEAVSAAHSRMIDGEPGYLMHPRCRVLRKAKNGGYCYRRVQIAGDDRFHDVPDKNSFSHVADAEQYLFIGGGESSKLIAPKDWGRKLVYPKLNVA